MLKLVPFCDRTPKLSCGKVEITISTIRLHLEREEWEPLHRLALEWEIPPELLAYTALNRLMFVKDDPATLREILHTREWRKENLPLWADPKHEVHAYESR